MISLTRKVLSNNGFYAGRLKARWPISGRARAEIALWIRIPSERVRPPLLGGICYVMDFVASSKTANPTGTKASSWLERMWLVRLTASRLLVALLYLV